MEVGFLPLAKGGHCDVRIKNYLRVDADPRFSDLKHRPLADELERPFWRQRPGPKAREKRVLGTITAIRAQERAVGLDLGVRFPADDLRPNGLALRHDVVM